MEKSSDVRLGALSKISDKGSLQCAAGLRTAVQCLQMPTVTQDLGRAFRNGPVRFHVLFPPISINNFLLSDSSLG